MSTHDPSRFLLHWLMLAWLAAVTATSVVAQNSFTHFEARQTHPIGLTPDGTRLLALNSPDARLSVFDVSNPTNAIPLLVAEIPVGLEPVSLRARTNDEVWVVNEVSDSVSVVSLRLGVVVATLPCADEPADVVFAQGKAFISGARNNLLRVFDVGTRSEIATIPLQGVSPSALAVDATGEKIYAAFQLSGNRTTVLPAGKSPPQPAPGNAALPAPPATALIVAANDPRVPYTVLDHDVVEISASTHTVTRYFSDAGTSLFDLALRPGTDELWVANTEALNRVRFEPMLRGHFVDNRLTRLDTTTGAATPFDLNAGFDYSMLPNPAAQATALAQPTAIAFSADGHQAWIAAFASDRVAKWNVSESRVLARVDVRRPSVFGPNDSSAMRGPRGLAWDEARQRLYVLNKLANTISVIDTTTDSIHAEIPTGTFDPTPAAVKQGRGFLFDARLSGNGTASCATCHLDADRDGLAWDLGDPNGSLSIVTGANLAIHDLTPQPRPMHPMKGPMITQTLRGLAANQLLHWRGDRATLRDFNPTFRDLMGGALIPDADINALKSYLDSLRHHPNPHRSIDNALPTAFNGGNPERGRTLFNAHINHCAVCHVAPTGSDNNVDDPRNIAAAQFLKTPPLQTVYQRALLDTRPGVTNVAGFGLLHDGTGGRQSLPTVHFYELDILSGADFADVAAFVMCFETGTAPAVGYQRTLSVANRNDPSLTTELNLMETQARTGGCDLVVRGRASGAWRQFLYDTTTRRYRSDRTSEPARTRAQLLTLLGPEDALTFLGTPPGQGFRLSVDRDGDGILDADEPRPTFTAAWMENTLRLSWSQANRDWLLEQAATLDGPWHPHSRGTDDGFIEQNTADEPGRFFRLRRTW